MQHPSERSGSKTPPFRILAHWLLQNLILTIVYGLCLFLPAGSIAWLAAWFYLAVNIACQTGIGLALRSTPGLLEKRMHSDRSSALPWDRPLTGIVSLFGPAASLIVAGLDRHSSWSSTTAGWQMFGGFLVLAGSLLAAWALVANRHFYGFVRIDEEGHTVIRSGPYAWIRHPGYAGALVFNLGAPLLLSSGWAFIPAGITILALGIRTILEDRYLRQNLPGYEEYANEVHWRLIPGVW